MDDALAELLAARPAEFVATRNRIVAELKAAGEAEPARQLAKLRRPSLVDWALNMTVREHPELVAEWIAAAEVAAGAQASGGSELRASLSTLRAVTARFVKAVGWRAPAGDVSQALSRIAADIALAGPLRAGTLGFDVHGTFATAADPTATARPPKPASPPDTAPRVAAAAAAAAELAEAEAIYTNAEADLADAATALERARATAQRAERDHLAAQRRLAAAHRIVVAARDQLQRAERKLTT
ncbi:MAG TPA: hypothetical protein VNQ73_11850 [Ilumatobacter sp.]|nr:hypothetical protein [Ilumatobacter sp.]